MKRQARIVKQGRVGKDTEAKATNEGKRHQRPLHKFKVKSERNMNVEKTTSQAPKRESEMLQRCETVEGRWRKSER